MTLNKFVLTLATCLVIVCSANGAEAFFGHCFHRGRSGCQPCHQRSMRTVCQPRASMCQPQMAQHHVYSGNQAYGTQAYGNVMYSQPVSQPVVGSGCVNCGTSGSMQSGYRASVGGQMGGQSYLRYPAGSGGQRSYSPVGNLPIGL
ncbi:hypothetical protein SH139x_005227 [Planctomycetaceae bacterium SH139]